MSINNDNGNCGTCYVASGYTPTQSLSNTGNAKFTITLVEQQETYYSNTKVQDPYYLNGKANLVISDNVVTYFKRPAA
ncbi:MAG: hypothetical protein NC548_29470 [Lachnospiraceae bacterium]|nr:hypothetical protein [Lachnospiraceae bacterium]